MEEPTWFVAEPVIALNSAGEGNVMNGQFRRLLFAVPATLVFAVGFWVSPAEAISTGKAELRGTELRIEGSDAAPNSTITADGIDIGSSNGSGDFDIRFSPFSSATCVAQVSDGSTTESVDLDRCTPSGPPANQSPNANAGADQTVVDADGSGGEIVTLDGTASADPDGSIATYSWAEGATVVANGSNPTADLAVGSHTITLTVTDNDGATATDTVVVTVDPPAAGNLPPIADAGVDRTFVDDDGNNIKTIGLDARGSSDPDGTIVLYEWTDEDGNFVSNNTTPIMGVAPGVYAFTLTVTDDQGATDTDVVVMTVEPRPGTNLSPTASAGPDQNVIDSDNNGEELVTLDGSSSIDDGTIVAYQWSENGVVLGANGTANQQGGAVANAVVGGTFDQILLGEQVDPEGFIPAAFGAHTNSAGDVNGDGFDDIVVVSPNYDNGPNPGPVVTDELAEGAAFVFLGSANGIVGSGPSTANARIEMNQYAARVTAAAGIGDVNGDGYGDIAIGSPFYESLYQGQPLEVNGAVFVYYGGPNGITGTDPSNADASIFSDELSGDFGGWLDGAGDVNNDGFDDLLVSFPGHGTPFPAGIPPNQKSGDWGAALIYLGGPNGITGTGFDDADTVIRSYENTGQPEPPIHGFIRQVAGVGDVNGDGFDDVLLGGGEGAVFHGSASGIPHGDLTHADARVALDPLGGNARVSAAGDVNGDGFADILLGEPGLQITAASAQQNGAAYVLHGSSAGITETSVNQAATRIIGDQYPQAFGLSNDGVGDVDNDGFDDIVITAMGYAGSLDLEGVGYLYRGGPNGINATSSLHADTRLEAAQSFAIVNGQIRALSAAGAGDINGDGFADIVMGKGFWTGTLAREGAAFIYFGESFPANPNQPPVADPGVDQLIQDVDQDGMGTFTVDGSASFDPDGSIVAYEWYDGETLLGTGPVISATLPTVGNHDIALVVTDNQGLKRGDIVIVRIEQSPSVQELNDGFSSLAGWTTTGDVTLADEGAPTPNPPHVRLQGDTSLTKTIPLTAGSTGIDVSFWANGSGFAAGDRIVVRASFDGGPFSEYFEMSGPDLDPPTGGFTFMGGSRVPIAISQYPTTASTVSFQFASELSPGAIGWVDSLVVRSLQPTIVGTNNPPVANAGPDQIVTDSDSSGSQPVTLDGSASTDADGTIVSYEWRENGVTLGTGFDFVADLSVGIHNITLVVTDNGGAAHTDTVEITVAAGSNNPVLVVPLSVGAHNITLSVTDDQGATGTDTVVVTVSSPSSNQAPVADAGPDHTVQSPGGGSQVINLNGGGSSDPDGNIVSFQWFENGIQVAAGPTPTVVRPIGEHTFTLTVTDDQGATASDIVVITVQDAPPPPNDPPIADAGPDQTIVDNDGNTLEVVTFDGSGSSDPDGTIVSYNWTKNGNPYNNAATFSLTEGIGVHTVTLTVTDDLGATASDVVIVTVEAAPAPGNELPIAVAGADQSLADPDGDGLASTSFDGTGSSDPDGSIASYEWRINGTLAGTGAIQGLVFPVGTNTLELTVRDNNDATATDTAIVVVAANQSPTAAAGPDQTVTDADGSGSESVTVDASASSDPDGTVQFWSWSDGTNVLATTEAAVLDLPIGSHTITLTVTDNGSATATDTVVVTVEDAPPPGGSKQVYISSSSGGSVDGVSFADEDILLFDTGTQAWSLFIDGSDIGLSGAGARDIDAFALLDDGSVLMSIVSGSTLPDVGAIDDSDIVRFVPSSTGTNTAGTFELYFDGSDVGLTTNGEDVDAISLLPGGDLLISTSGNPSVAGLNGLADEDLLRFSPTSLGATTAGSFSLWFDGSDVALNSSSSEDLHGASVDSAGNLHLTTRGTFAVSGASGTGADVFTCAVPTPGSTTSCGSFSLLIDGSAQGIGSEVVDGIHVVDR